MLSIKYARIFNDTSSSGVEESDYERKKLLSKKEASDMI